MVSFITRTCKVKTQTKYLSLRSSVYIILGDTRVPWSREAVLAGNTRQGWCSPSLSRLAGFKWYASVYHEQVQAP